MIIDDSLMPFEKRSIFENEGALEQDIIDPNSTDRCRSQSNCSSIICSYPFHAASSHILD
uniref:Uncharacterized protein n=1 Tax=Onchocerca volvulus TaxID=6282 RepID=A0A8R1TZT0_ONCVO